MAVTTIDTVETVPSSEGSLHGALDQPLVGTSTDVYSTNVVGWALGERQPVAAVEVYARGVRFIVGGVSQPRPDLSEAFPDVPWAGRSGFRVAVSLLGLPGKFELQIVARTDSGERTRLATVRGRRAPFRDESRSTVLPLLVTTLGRSGSTWLMRLLTHHPRLFAYRPFEQDTRVAAYWLDVLRTLTCPTSYSASITNPGTATPQWWTGDGGTPLRAESSPELAEWLGGGHVEELAQFCRGRITAFYEQMALQDGKERPLYVAEKVNPDSVPLLANDLFPDAPQLLLVRDLRDMYCSMVAYNKKRGNRSFGREQVNSEREHLRLVGHFAQGMLQSWRSRRDQVEVVRYEDLVTDPITTLHKIFKYVGLDDEPSTVADIVQRASRLSSGEEQHKTVADAAQSIGRWWRDLSPELRDICQEAFGPALEAFGYE